MTGPGTPWRLLALPPLPKDVLELLLGDPRMEVVVPPSRDQAAADELLPDVDLVLADWTKDLRVGDPGPRVALVQVPRAGVDGIDLDACAARGVPVANCAGANAVSVAEWCLSATFAMLRRTVEAEAAVRQGEWPQTSLGGRELSGMRVGVVGMGAIGSALASRYVALGCDVVHWSRTRRDDAPAPWVELDELTSTSDLVAIVIALGEQTRGLWDVARFAAMKPGALIVNAARGEVLDEDALLAALQEGRLAGAALDVFCTEPLPGDSPLRQAPNLLLSPHMAGSTSEAALRIIGQSKANLHRVLDGVAVVDVVNGVAAEVTRR
ncbi:MAG TPA: NAD(P)-dependent oxidoreductase [Mycobacteriales bacterium]|nr:NAD(P)-dependent oxidoreductase [Mycobacteriales bacterium]